MIEGYCAICVRPLPRLWKDFGQCAHCDAAAEAVRNKWLERRPEIEVLRERVADLERQNDRLIAERIADYGSPRELLGFHVSDLRDLRRDALKATECAPSGIEAALRRVLAEWSAVGVVASQSVIDAARARIADLHTSANEDDET